ncbi:DeoR family transcriptional regulator, partial [Atlantibacter hermannii]
MNDRQQRILQYVTDNQRVAVAELAGITGVSVVTVRHDLNYLEQG